MRVALVQILSAPYIDKRTGGGMYGLMNLASILERKSIQVDLLFFNYLNRKERNLHPKWKQVKVEQAQFLNEYDAVIFNSVGSLIDHKVGAWWAPILEKLSRPFAIWTISESDPKRRGMYSRYFLSHEWLRLIIESGENLAAQNGFLVEGKPLITYNFFPDIDADHILHPIYDFGTDYPVFDKEDTIIANSRLTTSKRIIELVKEAIFFEVENIAVIVCGIEGNYFYKQALLKLKSDSWCFLEGGFTHDDLPRLLGPCRWHFDGFWYSRYNAAPRLELVTVEAVCFDCVPVMERRTIPKWVDDSMAIIFDRKAMDKIPKLLRESKYSDTELLQNFRYAFTVYENPVEKAMQVMDVLIGA